jgi:hypothetical protein
MLDIRQKYQETGQKTKDPLTVSSNQLAVSSYQSKNPILGYGLSTMDHGPKKRKT